MGESPDKSVGDGEKAKSDAIKASASESTGSGLPVVWSPKLDAAEESHGIEAADGIPEFDAGEDMPPPDEEAVNEAASESSIAAPGPQSRFALLAATIALVAALGSFVGSLTASGVGRFLPTDVKAKSVKTANATEASDVLQAMRTQLAEFSVLKANIDGANRNANTQFAKIADRLDRLDKRATAAVSAPETTGSISAVPAPAPEPKPTVIEGWIVQDVENGRALVATRYGGVFEVGAGSFLPGLGRVEGIRREDGRWVVLTARGVITSMHQ